MGLDTSGSNSAHGVYLLFEKGKRPDRAAIKAFCASRPKVQISFEPEMPAHLRLVRDDKRARDDSSSAQPSRLAESDRKRSSKPQGKPIWVELLREGLTFDLEGLVPGPFLQNPVVRHFFDCDPQIALEDYEAIRLSVGAHLVGGERSLPVVKGMIALACELVQGFEGCAIAIWSPSHSAIGRRFFESTTTAWVEGGAFPALGLTAFESASDGALESVGLSFFIGQELRIEPALAEDRLAATRLAVRLVNQLVLIGGIESAERVIAPDGRRLVLVPSRNGQFIRVRDE